MTKSTKPTKQRTQNTAKAPATAKTPATAKKQAAPKTEQKVTKEKVVKEKVIKEKTEKEVIKNSVEVRKAFYEGFKKGFNTKTCYCKADTEMADLKDTSWKDEYQYLHIFKEGKKAQLFYMQFTGKKLYMVVSDNETVSKIKSAPSKAVVRIEPIIKVSKLAKPLEAETEYRHFLSKEQASKFTDGIPRAMIQKGAKIFCSPDVDSAVEVARLIRDMLSSEA